MCKKEDLNGRASTTAIINPALNSARRLAAPIMAEILAGISLLFITVALAPAPVGRGQSRNSSSNDSQARKNAPPLPLTDNRSTSDKNREARPGDAHNCYKLALKYARAGMFEQAERALNLAVELKPNYAEAHYELGNLYSERGRWRSTDLHSRPNPRLKTLATTTIRRRRRRCSWRFPQMSPNSVRDAPGP